RWRTHSRVYPAALSVVLDLRPDDWLQVRVFAQSGSTPWQPGAAPVAGAVLFEHVPDRGWVRHDPATAAPETGRIADATSAAAAADTPAPAHEQAGAPHDQAQPAEVWIEAPDAEAAAPLLDWLHTLPVTPGVRGNGAHEPKWPDRDVGWWMRASRRTMEELGDAWEQRPAGVAYFGTDRVRRLLSGSRAVTPRLRVGSSGVDWLAVSAEWDAEGRP